MYRRIFTVSTATVSLALSASAQASANPGAAQDLVYTQSEKPFVAMTIGETLQVAKSEKTKGYEKSGNPKAAGGPQNPGKGNAQKPSDVRPEQPIEKPKPEQPIEGVKPEQPIALPQPQPRDEEGTG